MVNEAVEELQRKLKTYLDAGWHIDPVDHVSFRYMIIHPEGEVYNNHQLAMNECPYCDEDDPAWTEAWCDHSPELLAKEETAKELYEIIDRLEHSGVQVF